MNAPNRSISNKYDYDLEFEILRSLSSSSEHENSKIDYVRPTNLKKIIIKKKGGSSGTIKWEVGQKFVNMIEFRETVRRYGGG